MLYQEVALWDAKRTKEKTKYSSGPHQILSMTRLIDKQIKAELNKKPAKSSSRVKRELDLAKQTGLIEDFRLEHAGLSMLLHDGEGTKHRFHEIRTFQLGMCTHLTVPREMRGSSLLNKYQQRLTGYTQTLVTALHQRREGTDGVGNARGCRLWALSSSIARIVSGRSRNEPVQWPQSADIVEILFTLELIEQQSAALREASPQDTGLPSGGSGGSLAGSVHSDMVVTFSQGLERITESYHILTKILMLLRDWPDEDEMDVVIIQWFRAFKATLSSEYMPHVDVHDGRREAGLEEGSAVTSAIVALEVAWWTRAMCNGKRNELNPHEIETPIDDFSEHDESVPLSQWQKKQIRARHNVENNINVKANTAKVVEEIHLPSLREEGDGFYLAVVSTYPDVFFASRSVFMHLLKAVSARKITLVRRNQYMADMDQVQSTATSKAEIEVERSLAAEAEAARQTDILFIDQSRVAMLKLAHSALDLCQLVLTPLEDVFCSVRRLGIGDFRYIENGERCVTETLRLVCAVVAACTSERPLGSTFTAPEPIRQVPTTQPTINNRRVDRKAAREPETVRDDSIVEEAQVFTTVESETLLHRCYKLFNSCSQICVEGIENIPMQSALMQSVNTIAIYLLQENARLLRFRNLAAEELAMLKPVAQVLTDIFGAGVAAAEADPSVETEQQRWDRVTMATKRPHRSVVANLISAMTEVVPSLLSSMSVHKEIPSVQYYGFLNLRLLFRLPFFKTNQLEELLAEGGGMDGDSLDGGLGGGVTGHSESMSAGDSMFDVDGSLSMLSISEWRGAHTAEAGALYSRETHRESCRERLANVIAFTGENHASKLEVLEQYLLFLLHACGSSLECQGILQHIKIDVVLQRITILQHQSPYFTALCELLKERLKAVEDAM